MSIRPLGPHPTIREAAAMLGRNVTYVRRMLKSGVLQRHDMGDRRVFVKLESIEKLRSEGICSRQKPEAKKRRGALEGLARLVGLGEKEQDAGSSSRTPRSPK